jgi:hypothetical protein
MCVNISLGCQVAGSIPDEVIGFLNWPNPSSHAMAPGSTHSLTEMSTKNLPGGKGRPTLRADLRAFCEPIGALTSHSLHGLMQG